MSLHPDHLADLKCSGLTPDTIRAAGIYTVTPGGIGKKLGGNDYGISSLLAFPYPGCEGYERFKCWYEDGKSGPKYRQKKDSPNRLYLPSTVDLAGDSHLWWWKVRKKPWPPGKPDSMWWGSAGCGTGAKRERAVQAAQRNQAHS